jgi:hypothetical protein
VGAYGSFLETKARVAQRAGIDVARGSLHPRLFDFQREIVERMLGLGRGAIFASTGLGKTDMQVEWARQVVAHGNGDVMIFAPLAVAAQTVREATLLDAQITLCREADDVRPGINITNYDRLDRFDLSRFGGIVLDESSILKSTDGKTRSALIEAAQGVRFRLACTATPAPNDVMELGNHAEFLGAMRTAEMLATYFVHDGGETQKWRLKGHAEKAFWAWVGSWASVVDSPVDLGYDGSAYVLPPLRMHEHVLDAPDLINGETLFALPASSLMERRSARSVSVETRVAKAAEILRATRGPWLVWCGLNREADAMKAVCPELVEVRGSDTREDKESRLIAFSEGRADSLLSKASICGFGLNWQHCSQMIFLGIDDSWESLYQAIRRCWRFGQKKPVDVHLILSSAEIRVLENLKRKERDAARLRQAMAREAQFAIRRRSSAYTATPIEVPFWLHSEAL